MVSHGTPLLAVKALQATARWKSQARFYFFLAAKPLFSPAVTCTCRFLIHKGFHLMARGPRNNLIPEIDNALLGTRGVLAMRGTQRHSHLVIIPARRFRTERKAPAMRLTQPKYYHRACLAAREKVFALVALQDIFFFFFTSILRRVPCLFLFFPSSALFFFKLLAVTMCLLS